MTKTEFLNIVSKLVIEENNRRGKPLFPSVVIAQAICETGWGQSPIMMKANAIFGIKAYGWNGKVYNAKTKECYDGKTYVTIDDCFRAYNNIGESVSDYFDLITKSERYRKACVANSPLECITAIKNGGYATSPSYIDTIMSIIKGSNLTKYDNVETVENSVDNYYKKGKVYTLQVNLFVRYGAGKNFDIKKYNELTEDGKKHAIKQDLAVLKKGTRVTCLSTYTENNNIWLQIPSGFVAGKYQGKDFIK